MNTFNMGELPQKVIELCKEINAEPIFIQAEDTLVFIAPKIPSGEIQAKMIGLIPSFLKTKWMMALKIQTLQGLKLIFAQLGIGGNIKDNNHGEIIADLTIAQESPAFEKDSPLWDSLIALCKADGYPTVFKLILNGKTIFSWDKDMERLLAEHITEGLVIRPDDILNLTISLETCKSVDEFLATI